MRATPMPADERGVRGLAGRGAVGARRASQVTNAPQRHGILEVKAARENKKGKDIFIYTITTHIAFCFSGLTDRKETPKTV